MDAGVESHRLRQEIERSLRRAFDPADVLPRLVRLARLAPPASDDGIFAHRQLAELLVERHPWRAALYARRALAHRADDDRAWAILAFCQTLLGNFRCAAAAYKKAIASSPSNPWYAHNLGHLLDVALGAPRRALPFLRSAYLAKTENSEIVASYVHALGRAGHTDEARGVLERALERFDSRELEALLRWLDQGAPSPSERKERKRARGGTGSAAQDKRDRFRKLTRLLERGLLHLPLDSRQRARAIALARDVVAEAARAPHAAHATRGEHADLSKKTAPTQVLAGRARTKAPTIRRRAGDESNARAGTEQRDARDMNSDDFASLAAAVAYAIVYVDHVPLSQAEVAAPFRVAVGRLRGRFAELRAKLDIIPGDARYATTRG